MKCPKCEYLGFETGDRCKNCGYDFSLLAMPGEDGVADDALPLRSAFDEGAPADVWLNQLDAQLAPAGPARLAPLSDDAFDISLTPTEIAIEPEAPPPVREVAPIELDELDALDKDVPGALLEPDPEPVLEPAPEPLLEPISEQVPESPMAPALELPTSHPRVVLHAVPQRAEAALPLFTPEEDASQDAEDDEPLIKLPAAPRAPLAVRRTPDTPRLRAVPKLTIPERELEADREPALAFGDEPLVRENQPPPAEADERLRSRVWRGPASNGEPGAPGCRIVAAAVDHAILLTIDLVVVYFTLRMAALDMTEWPVLPQAPLVTFLVVIKLAYFYAFTAIGGQTIGKMAARIRVVTEADGELESGQAARRTLGGAVSALTLGLGFLPGLLGQRRALHDRLAGTRVVGLEG